MFEHEYCGGPADIEVESRRRHGKHRPDARRSSSTRSAFAGREPSFRHDPRDDFESIAFWDEMDYSGPDA